MNATPVTADTHQGVGASGLAAIILASSLGVGWAVCLVIGSLPSGDGPTPESASLLNGIGQVLAGAVATFLGSQIPTRRTSTPVDLEPAPAAPPIPAAPPVPPVPPAPPVPPVPPAQPATIAE